MGRTKGVQRNAEIRKSPQAEGMINSRNMDTAAVCSTLQLISTEGKVGDAVSPSADIAGKQSQQAGGQQTYLTTMDVHTT